MRRMPEMIEATERKLAGLYREARRYTMSEVLVNPAIVEAAWNREIALAQLRAARLGQETTIAGDGV